MSKRKPKREYQGEGYPDYRLLFEGMTEELQKLYQSLWRRRKESLEVKNMAKQVKTSRPSPVLLFTNCGIAVKARIILMLTPTAVCDLSTLLSMATPLRVKA